MGRSTKAAYRALARLAWGLGIELGASGGEFGVYTHDFDSESLYALWWCLCVSVGAPQVRQSFVRVDGNRLRIKNGEKDFDTLLDESVTLRCIEKDSDALLELHNVCKPPKKFSRIMSARMSLRLHFTSVQDRNCWHTVMKLAIAIPQPCQHWYSGDWKEESIVFRRKVTDGLSGTWLEVLTGHTWPEEGGKVESEHSLRSLVLEPMRVDISHPGASYLERVAGMQVVCCQVHVDNDVVCAGAKRISSEGRVKLLLRETASSPMPQWNLLRLAIHECGGAEADATATQMFVARHHAMMFVCDAATLEEEPCIERVCWWINRARQHTHHRRVFLVATRGDELSEYEREAMQSKLMIVLRSIFEGRTDTAPLVGDRIFFVNLHSLNGVDALREAMCELLAQVPQPGFEPTVPCRYARLGDLVRSLRERRAVITFAELADTASRRLGFAPLKEPFGKTEAWREWTDMSDVEMALELLHQRGEVFWLHQPAKLREWVFLKPRFVAKLVRRVWQTPAPVRTLKDRGVLQLDMLPSLWETEREVFVIGCVVLAELLAAFGVLDHSLHHASITGEHEAHKQRAYDGESQMDTVDDEAVSSPDTHTIGSDVITNEMDEDLARFTDELATNPVLEETKPPRTPGVADHDNTQTTAVPAARAVSPQNVPLPLAAEGRVASPRAGHSDTSRALTQTSSAPSGTSEPLAPENVDGGAKNTAVAGDGGSAEANVATMAAPCDRKEPSGGTEASAINDTELVGSDINVHEHPPNQVFCPMQVSKGTKSKFWFMGCNNHGQFGLGHW